MPITWELLHPALDLEMLGPLRYFISDRVPDSAARQIHGNYRYGGWRPFPGFKLMADNKLKYAGDPPLPPIARARLRDELILLYPGDWVAVIQPDRSFEVSRID